MQEVVFKRALKAGLSWSDLHPNQLFAYDFKEKFEPEYK